MKVTSRFHPTYIRISIFGCRPFPEETLQGQTLWVAIYFGCNPQQWGWLLERVLLCKELIFLFLKSVCITHVEWMYNGIPTICDVAWIFLKGGAYHPHHWQCLFYSVHVFHGLTFLSNDLRIKGYTYYTGEVFLIRSAVSCGLLGVSS
jgi:hypothetical protein